MNIETIDHVKYPKSLRSKDIQSLLYIVKDCREAIAANPTGHKSGYYADEINYVGMELQRRKLQVLMV